MKKVIWALYDDAEGSVKKTVEKYFNDTDIELHSIGINDLKNESDKYFYHKIDLSLMNINLIKQLEKLPAPDIILASPPCESWSGADCNGRMFRSIDENGNWVVKNQKYYDEYNETCHPVKRRNFIQKERGRLIGEATVGGLIEILKHFKPNVWVIENPKTSRLWDFISNHYNFTEGFNNDTYYSAYSENFSLKPTIFKSNIELDLLKERKTGNKTHMAKGSYTIRSSIPTELLYSIIRQILEKMEVK